MTRCALVGYLAMVTVAGPWFCCCTTARVGACLSPLATSDDQSGPRRTCCGDHPHGNPRHGNDSHVDHSHAMPDQQASDSDQPSCPCRENGSRETLVLSDVTGATQVRLQLEPVAAWDRAATVPAAVSMPAEQDWQHRTAYTTFPFMSAQEILRALQTFLC